MQRAKGIKRFSIKGPERMAVGSPSSGGGRGGVGRGVGARKGISQPGGL